MSSFNIHQVAVDKKASSTRLGLSLMGIAALILRGPTDRRPHILRSAAGAHTLTSRRRLW
jgi:hypothetical protein